MRLLLLSLALIVACGETTAKRGDDVVGKVTAVTGEVSATRPEKPAERVTLGLVVTRDMSFTTAAGSSLEVTFANGYAWTLEEKQTRAVAGLAVIDRPTAAGGEAPGKHPEDRTASAGRHAEQEAGETEATAPPPGAAAPVTTPTPAPAAEPVPPPPPPAVAAPVTETPRPKRPPAKPPRIERPDLEQEVPEKTAPVDRSPPPAPPPPAPVTAPPPPKPAEPGPMPPPADAPPSGGAPDRLTAEEIRATLRSTDATVARTCKVAAETRLRLRITIAASGQVTAATAEGEHQKTPLEACAARIVKSLRFRRFGGEPQSVIYPYRLPAP